MSSDTSSCLGTQARFACDPRRSVFDSRGHTTTRAEPEANRFASELLVPTCWLEPTIQTVGTDAVGPLLKAIERADVSVWVACLRLIRLLPRGFVFAMVDLGGLVLLSGQSDDTGLSPPDVGERLDRRLLDRFAAAVEAVRYGTRRIIWWRFGETAPTRRRPLLKHRRRRCSTRCWSGICQRTSERAYVRASVA